MGFPFLNDSRGAGAIEFAFLTPLVIMMALLTADLGIGGYQQMQVQSAAEAGAQYAVVNGFSKSGIAAAVQSATPNTGISATPDPIQFCGCPGFTAPLVVTCGSTCSNGRSAGSYVTVNTALNYTTIVSYPGFANSYLLSSQATVRMQ